MDRAWAPEIEKLIRDGKLDQALSSLARFAPKIKKREDRVQLANFYRRLSRSEDSLRLLIGVVRPPIRRPVKATVAEKSEYAAALADVGASKEAIGLLSDIHSENHAPGLLFEAFSRMGRWEYQEAVDCLEEYIGHRDITDYQRQVASINLIHSLKFVGRLDEAGKVATQAVAKAAAGESRLIEAAALEAFAEVELDRGRSDQALELLNKSEALLPDSGFVMRFLVGKWKAVAEFRRHGDAKRAAIELAAIRQAALDRGFWEIVRDCEFQSALITQDAELMLKLFHGTPHANYRRQILRMVKENFAPQACARFEQPYEFFFGAAKPGAIRLDLKSGRRSDGGVGLKLGQIPHRLLNVLTRDLFKPWSVAAIFAELFPDRYLNIETSPATVRNAVVRLEQWFTEAKLPLEVHRVGGLIRLQSSREMSLLYPAQPLAKAQPPRLLPKEGQVAPQVHLEPRHYEIRDQLENLFGAQSFSTLEAAEALFLSRRSCQRYLIALEASGMLSREGDGKLTRFQLASASAKAA